MYLEDMNIVYLSSNQGQQIKYFIRQNSISAHDNIIIKNLEFEASFYKSVQSNFYFFILEYIYPNLKIFMLIFTSLLCLINSSYHYYESYARYLFNFICIRILKSNYSVGNVVRYEGGYVLNKNLYLQVQFSLDQQQDLYERSVYSMLDFFGFIGGLFQIFQMIGFMLISAFSQIRFYN